jgi:hypothetical protein
VGGEWGQVRVKKFESLRQEGINQKCDFFKYLGSIITDLSTSDIYTENRNSMRKLLTTASHKIQCNNNIPTKIKKNTFHIMVQCIMLYGDEMWPLTDKLNKRKPNET